MPSLTVWKVYIVSVIPAPVPRLLPTQHRAQWIHHVRQHYIVTIIHTTPTSYDLWLHFFYNISRNWQLCKKNCETHYRGEVLTLWSIWNTLRYFYPLWETLINFETFEVTLRLLKSLWEILIHFEIIWPHWSTLKYFELVWSTLR